MYDVFELIESELGLDRGTLCDEIADDPEKVKNNLTAVGLFEQDVLLAMDLNQKGSSAPLLTKGMNLWENIDAVIKRIANNPDSIERPKVVATEKVNVYLKKRIINHVESMKENILKSTKFKRIYKKAQRDKSLAQILDSLGEIVDKFLSKPETISPIFQALNDKHSTSLLEESVNAACISMFTLKNRNDFYQYSDESRDQLINVGSAALFKDISRIFYPNDYPTKEMRGHSEKSAKIAQSLGLDPDVICVIRYHHIIDNKLCRNTKNEQLYKEVIDVVELFMDLTSNKNFSENEIIIALNNLAYKGLLEINTVTSLGNMYGGKDKNTLIAIGQRLIKDCDNPNRKAYIWDPEARVPYAVICANKSCPNFGGYSVVTYRTIEADFDLGIVPKGVYQYCRELTRLLLKGGIKNLEDELVTELCKKLNINLDSKNEQNL